MSYCRWVKYEEDVEENGKRWSKPHVASVTLHNVFELRSELSCGVMMLGIDVKNLKEIAGNYIGTNKFRFIL